MQAVAADRRTLHAWLGAGTGGLSGPAIRAFALGHVREVAAAVSIPVIGMGGIESGADAVSFLAAGASAVAVGTASFRDPQAGNRVREELEIALRRAGADSPRDVKGRMAASTST